MTTTPRTLTLDELIRFLGEAVGEDEDLSLDGSALDIPFSDLGYDSLAVLETAGRIARELPVSLSDAAVADALTPRALLELVNQTLVGRD